MRIPKMVAVGGGNVPNGETLAIDRTIVSLTDKRKPRALMIRTASGDSDGSLEAFNKVYQARLGCRTEDLLLLRCAPTRAELEEGILGADVIYVPGGNTLKMMRRWRHLGVDSLLQRALYGGTVMAGVSAGAICRLAHGHSDRIYSDGNIMHRLTLPPSRQWSSASLVALLCCLSGTGAARRVRMAREERPTLTKHWRQEYNTTGTGDGPRQALRGRIKVDTEFSPPHARGFPVNGGC